MNGQIFLKKVNDDKYFNIEGVSFTCDMQNMPNQINTSDKFLLL
jgi:hypothetical protein